MQASSVLYSVAKHRFVILSGKRISKPKKKCKASSQFPIPWPTVYARISVSWSHLRVSPCYRH